MAPRLLRIILSQMFRRIRARLDSFTLSLPPIELSNESINLIINIFDL